MLTPISFATAIIALIGVVWTYLDSRRRRLRQREMIDRITQRCDDFERQIESPESQLARIDLRSELDSIRRHIEERISIQTTELSTQRATSDRRFSDQQHGIDHLLAEEQNLCMLPRWNPTRLELLDRLLPSMKPLIETLEPALFPTQLPLDELDWMYRLPEKKFPYSLTFEEGMLIYHLIRANQLSSGYEIATAFGFSGCFIGRALHENGGNLLTVDAYIEEDQEDFLYSLEATRKHVASMRDVIESEDRSQWPLGLQWAKAASEKLGIQDSVEFRVGCSPDDIGGITGQRTFDFAFIDGGHFGEQPVKDFDAVSENLNDQKFLIVFHDTQCEAVAKGVHHAAVRTGCKPWSLHTRNRLVVMGRGLDESIFETCRSMTLRQYV
ncbi:MAG: class I SAM-dependent methyltransferase [Planctomycetota bacterium]